MDKHPVLRNWYMDDERYGDGKGLSSGAETLGKTAIAAAGARGIARGSKIANAVFVPVAGKFVAKKTVISVYYDSSLKEKYTVIQLKEEDK